MRRYISYRRQDEEAHLLQEAGLWRYICRVCYTTNPSSSPSQQPSGEQLFSALGWKHLNQSSGQPRAVGFIPSVWGNSVYTLHTDTTGRGVIPPSWSRFSFGLDWRSYMVTFKKRTCQVQKGDRCPCDLLFLLTSDV